MQQAYYNEKLYPLQDKVLELIQHSESDFYLTGGTALSRAWLHHRYSDDLDFFVNNAQDFSVQVQKLYNILQPAFGDQLQRLMDTSSFHRWVIDSNTIQLKIELINDVAYRKGNPVKTELFIRTDSVENIMSNKICALSRNEPKDFADLIFIEKKFTPQWSLMIEDAKMKDLSINEIEIAAAIGQYDVHQLEKVRWINPPEFTDCADTLTRIAQKIITGD